MSTTEKINGIGRECGGVRPLWVRWSGNFSVEVKLELKPERSEGVSHAKTWGEIVFQAPVVRALRST